MLDAFAVIVATATQVTPTPAPAVDPNLVTPGPWGFAIIAFITLAVILLVTDMLRRVRRGRVRADILEELQEQQAKAEGDGAAGGTDSR